MKSLVLKNVVKDFGEVKVIKNINLQIDDGEFCVFVGPSGCGKSTLLRLIAGLEEATSGTIHLGDKELTNLEPAKRGIAMVFQSYALYPHMSVGQNMGFGLKMAKTPKSQIDEKVGKAADILQIQHLLDRKPKELSGGQRQRVAIGRAIVREPEVFLFDEPLSNLDAELRVSMRVEIAKLHNDLKSTMIYVTHDQVEAMTLADKIVILRLGIIEQAGKPLDLFRDPDNIFVAGFLGTPRMNFLDGVVESVNDNTANIKIENLKNLVVSKKLDNPPSAGTKVKLGIRPQFLTLNANGTFNCKLNSDVTEHFGTSSYVYAKNNAGDLMVIEVEGHLEMNPGSEIDVSFEGENVLVFDASSENRIR